MSIRKPKNNIRMFLFQENLQVLPNLVKNNRRILLKRGNVSPEKREKRHRRLVIGTSGIRHSSVIHVTYYNLATYNFDKKKEDMQAYPKSRIQTNCIYEQLRNLLHFLQVALLNEHNALYLSWSGCSSSSCLPKPFILCCSFGKI